MACEQCGEIHRVDRLNDAIYDTVHEFRDERGRIGAKALGPKLGIQSGTLSNMANPDQAHKLGLLESIPLQLMAKDFQILYAYSTELGHLPPVPYVDFTKTSDADLICLLSRFHADIGKSMEALNEALQHKRITHADVERVRKGLLESQQAGHELLCRLEALSIAEAHRASR